jgi:hypothetical protein
MKKSIFLIVAFVIGLMVTSCRPYHEEVYVDIQPNETAFLIPLEEGTQDNQEMLKSAEYLETRKVAAKRVYTPTIWHQTGRIRIKGEWIPTVIVVKVDRAPVTREWTEDTETGTEKTKQDINVESKESIGFGIGITCTASIPEELASTFLYYYNGKTLENVMDNNVRSFIQDILTSEFGIRELSQCQAQRKEIFNVMKQRTTEFFLERGVRIDNIGAAGEFHYINPEIQTAINLEFVAEKKRDAAENEVAAAQQFARAANTIAAQKELDANILIMEAFAEAVRTGKLPVPQTLVMGSGGMSLMDVYGAQNLNK